MRSENMYRNGIKTTEYTGQIQNWEATLTKIGMTLRSSTFS